jgi:sulfate transport system permease protein
MKKTNNLSFGALILIGVAILFASIFLLIPLLVIFKEAFSKGYKAYFSYLSDQDSVDAIKLTLQVTVVAVILNLIFGLAAAWCITKFKFSGKNLLTTLIDLPFSVSPVIAGLIYVITFGSKSFIGSLLVKYNIAIIFAIPGIILTTMFITLPFIARELIVTMEQLGSEEEEAAMLLGAKGWQILFYITIPKVKWGLLYGVLLCTARALGEFGAVSVVSGHIRGLTNTVPLHVEILYNEYNFTAAFAVSSILTIAALVTLLLKSYIEWRYKGGSR